jgi:hypothetical protein
MNEIDPPEETFRIRLVCTLLETCGQYFSKGATKEKLDRFLVYFQRYALSKGDNVSQALWFTIDDRFAELRPRMQRFNTIQEAIDAVTAIEKSKLENLRIQIENFQNQTIFLFCCFKLFHIDHDNAYVLIICHSYCCNFRPAVCSI